MVMNVVLSLGSMVGLDVKHFTELHGLASRVLEIPVDQNDCTVGVVRLAIVGERICHAGGKCVDCSNNGFGPSVCVPVEVQCRVVLVHDFKGVSVGVEVGVVKLEEAVCN